MKHILTVILLLAVGAGAWAQPKARTAAKPKSAAPTLTTRAQISYPKAQTMSPDVTWRRDIYREVDITVGDNRGLYYPVEPVGAQMNLFTYLFRLVLSGQVKAYEYRLDGNESFEADAVVKPLTLLDNYHIYYERKDGRLRLDNSDIPSREVKTYYVKQSAYYDQRTATYHVAPLALCPIMSREDDFGDGATRYPLFWVKYADIAPFLAKQTIMTSDLNNAAVMSVDDYFTKNLYQGRIYKTNNLLGQTIAQRCPTDSAQAREQKRIEAELLAFEQNIWGDKARKDSLDSIAAAGAALSKSAKRAARKNRRAGGTAATAQSATAAGNAAGTATATKKRTRNTGGVATGTSGRMTVRRQRH